MNQQVPGTPLVYEDDASIHPVGPEPDWRESYYLNFASIDGDISGIVWQGVRPNSCRGEAVFVLYEGDTPLLHSVNMQVDVPADVGTERTRLGHQEFECVDPWRHWRVTYDDGTDRVALDWTQISDTCNWHWQDLQSSIHYQGSGRVEGVAVIKGREIPIVGYGDRDRAWGKRNYGPLKFAVNFFSQFDDESMLHAFVLLDAAGHERLHGYLHRDGVTRDLVEYDADFIYLEEGRPPAAARHRAKDTDGREIEISETHLRHALEYATAVDGANLEGGTSAPKGAGSRMFLASYWYLQPTGERGVGCIDMNFWNGHQQNQVRARGPLYSKLYGFGRGVDPKDATTD
ncbi:DUF7065 domain-containing protein [Rhodococcus opacus]|nr:hypothetical protein [Rhodococcus opacus]